MIRRFEFLFSFRSTTFDELYFRRNIDYLQRVVYDKYLLVVLC